VTYSLASIGKVTSSTALGLGLEEGLKYAADHGGDRHHLGRIVRAGSAVEVSDAVAGSVLPPEGIDQVAYWSGFAHGVGRYLREHLDLE
jgi:hypothetical protein